MEEAQTEGTGTPAPGRGPKKPNVRILLGFLAVFLLLIIVFREVLFPFLLAIFLAYLIEPVVARVEKSRLFGMKWTRGPTIVLLYVILVGGLTFGAWKGLTKAASKVQEAARSVTREIKREGGRAIVRLVRDESAGGAATHGHVGPDPIVVPKGSILQAAEVRYETLHDAVIAPGESEAAVLLDLAGAPSEYAARPAEGDRLTLSKGEVQKPADIRLHIKKDSAATGVELMFERRLIGPIVKNLDKFGWSADPTTVREFVKVKGRALSQDLPDRIGKFAVKAAGSLALSIYEFFLILMITAFIVMDRRRIADFFASLPPPKYRASYLKLMEYVDDGLAGVIRGQLMICLVNGVLTYIGLLLLAIPGALWLSLLAAVLSLIPIFGTIISSIPIVLIGATKGVSVGILALAWIVFIHVVEANVLNPIIMGSHAKMHPVVIIFSLLAGEHYFGVWGALLAVPTMSLIQSCFLFYLHEVEGKPKPGPDAHGDTFKKAWAWLKGRFSGAKAKA